MAPTVTVTTAVEVYVVAGRFVGRLRQVFQFPQESSSEVEDVRAGPPDTVTYAVEVEVDRGVTVTVTMVTVLVTVTTTC